MQKLNLVGTEIQDFKFHFGVLELEKLEVYHQMAMGEFLKKYGDGLTTKISLIWVGLSRFQPKYSRDDIGMILDSYVEQGGDMALIQTVILKELEDFGIRSKNGTRAAAPTPNLA